ncbi:nickel pincer cofactor biosynthesis protein LarB [bacterium]|nr:nickel pincer cofactor biosynthesis protein LarB [bacterium]
MESSPVRRILDDLAAGRISADVAEKQLAAGQIGEMGFAALDLWREARRGRPEVVFGEGKTAEQIAAIALRMTQAGQNVLVTRVDAAKRAAVAALVGEIPHVESEAGRLMQFRVQETKPRGGLVAVLAAGTSDLPVAEEAACTAEWLGSPVERAYDVGVAGLHRLLARGELLRKARVLVVVAGMEGALPTVVSGLVARPVIAVPTSVGYGASFRGLSALLTMLNSCSSGVSVVNIDNGFGAGYLADMINEGGG